MRPIAALPRTSATLGSVPYQATCRCVEFALSLASRAYCRLVLGVGCYAFSSHLSSSRNRQSVPWEMSVAGLILIIPTSWKRRAWKRSVSSGLAVRQCHLVTKRVASGDFAGPTRSHPAFPWHLADEAAKESNCRSAYPRSPLAPNQRHDPRVVCLIATLVCMGAYGKRCCRQRRDFAGSSAAARR